MALWQLSPKPLQEVERIFQTRACQIPERLCLPDAEEIMNPLPISHGAGGTFLTRVMRRTNNALRGTLFYMDIIGFFITRELRMGPRQ